MIRAFDCKGQTVHDGDLLFSLDDETLQISGMGAVMIAHELSLGTVSWHPLPGPDFELSQNGGLIDLAVVVGSRWILPEYLAPFYPERPEDPPVDDDGGDYPVVEGEY